MEPRRYSIPGNSRNGRWKANSTPATARPESRAFRIPLGSLVMRIAPSLDPDGSRSDLLESRHHRGVVARHDQLRPRGELPHTVLRPQVRGGVQRGGDGRVLLEVLVEIQIVA